MSEIKWKIDNVKYFHIELSNFCSVSCPACPRYIEGTSVVNPDLKLNNISYQDFIKWFPKQIIENSEMWLFCGTTGDPAMAKDLYEICEYILKNSKAYIQINTNGSIRNSDFWENLGLLFSKYTSPRPVVVFSIDGLKDTNHLYRRNADWEKIINNLKSYLKNGAEGHWDYLVFKHNEHQIKEAEILAADLGIKEFRPKRAFGFETSNPDEYQDLIVYDRSGNYHYSIEPPSIEFRNTQATKKIESKNIHNPLAQLKINTKKQREEYWEKIINEKYSEYKFPEQVFENTEVKCLSCKQDDNNFMEIYVDANGNVFPCCFVGTVHNSDITTNESIQIKYKVKDWGRENINLNKFSLREIIQRGHLNKIFTEGWKKDSKEKIEFCYNNCGKSIQMNRLKINES